MIDRDITDAMAALPPGGHLREHRTHSYLVVATNLDGFHTGRRRYLVACTTCEKLLHEATTGADLNIEAHERDIKIGDPTP